MNDLIVYIITMLMISLDIKCLVTKSQKASKRRCAQILKMFKLLYYLQYNTCRVQFLHAVTILNKTLIHCVLVLFFLLFFDDRKN